MKTETPQDETPLEKLARQIAAITEEENGWAAQHLAAIEEFDVQEQLKLERRRDELPREKNALQIQLESLRLRELEAQSPGIEANQIEATEKAAVMEAEFQKARKKRDDTNKVFWAARERKKFQDTAIRAQHERIATLKASTVKRHHPMKPIISSRWDYSTG